ncbi:nuclease-related domain-containing protein [Methylobacterium radiotolerans]
MSLLPNAPDLFGSLAAIDGTLAGPALVASAGLLASSFVVLLGLMRKPAAVSTESLAARLAAKAEIGRVATTSLHDVRIPTPIETLAVDHLVKAGGGAILVGSVALDGTVEGGARDPVWNVTQGRTTRTIPNPMIQVAQRVQAVRKASHGALPVTGLVLYTGEPMFENGSAPEGVVPVKAAGAKFVELAAGMPTDEPRSRAWALLCAQLLRLEPRPHHDRTQARSHRRVVAMLQPSERRTRPAAGEQKVLVFAFPGREKGPGLPRNVNG